MFCSSNYLSVTGDILLSYMMIAMDGGISLLVREPEREIGDYPSYRIQKGLILVHDNKDLSEEGVGFGVPVLKFGQKTIFPGNGCITIRKDEERTFVNIDYDLNLAEMIYVKGRRIESRIFYKIIESLSTLHRKYPFSRKLLTHGSIAVRRAFGIETRFEKISPAGSVRVEYNIGIEGIIHVSADLSTVKTECTEVMIMNEQGADYFDTCYDSKGTLLTGNEIGSWRETFSNEVSFIDSHDNIAFTLSRVGGSKMFFGRELVANRLAWSGLAYSLSPHRSNFEYDIRIGAGK